MRLGIGTYCYMWAMGVEGAMPANPLSPLGLLDEARRLQVQVVQFGPNRPLREAEIEPVAEQAVADGVELELGMMGLGFDEVRAHLRICGRLNARLLRTVDLYQGAASDPAEFERKLRAVLPLLDDSGVRLGVENARIPAATMSGVLDAIGSPRIGITLDTVNSLAIPEGTREVVSHLARHTICLHVKDFEVKRIWHLMGFTVEGTAAGAGQEMITLLPARVTLSKGAPGVWIAVTTLMKPPMRV